MNKEMIIKDMALAYCGYNRIDADNSEILIEKIMNFEVSIWDIEYEKIRDGHEGVSISVGHILEYVYQVAIENACDELDINVNELHGYYEIIGEGIDTVLFMNDIDVCNKKELIKTISNLLKDISEGYKVYDIDVCNKKELTKTISNLLEDISEGIIKDLPETYLKDDVPEEYKNFHYDFLDRLPTISEGQFEDLKIKNNVYKVWLSRMTEEDGEWCNNPVSIERFDKNLYRWETVFEYDPRTLENRKDYEASFK